MTSLKEFRNEIILYAVGVAALAEVISLVVIGPGIMFPAGLAAGTAVSVIGFVILVKTGQTLVEESSKAPVLLGYMLRLAMYGVSFFFCIRASLPCGFGCATGFITIHVGIMVLYGIVYRFIKKKENPLNDWTEPKEWNDLSIYDEEEDDWPKPENRIGSPEYAAAHPEYAKAHPQDAASRPEQADGAEEDSSRR